MEVRCPTCRGKVVWEENLYRPFCSERCKALDLGRWLAEEYRIPGSEDEEFESGHEESGDPDATDSH